MSNPDRWLDSGDIPPEARELLRAGRRPRPMTRAERSRTASRATKLAAVPVAIGALVWIKGIALAAGLCAAGVVAYHALVQAPAATQAPLGAPAAGSASASLPTMQTPPPPSSPPPPSPPPPAAETPSPEASADPPKTAAPAARAEGRPPPPAAAAEADSSAPVEADSLTREVALLEQARALLASRPGEALARLEQHAANFPKGKLGIEREFLIMDALRRLGRVADARARGQALLARSRGGLYEERVERILKSMP